MPPGTNSSNLKRFEFVGGPFTCESYISRSKMRPNLFPIRRGRQPQNENAVPFKVQMPLALRNSVTGKGTKATDKGCLYEISLVLSCLQQNNFENKFCTKEVTAFQNCYREYEANRANTMEQTRKGILTPYSKDLKRSQVNILLKKYPQH